MKHSGKLVGEFAAERILRLAGGAGVVRAAIVADTTPVGQLGEAVDQIA